MTQFSESTNPYRVKLPVQLQRSSLPGYVVHTPDPALITARKRPGQVTDQDLCVVYHNALSLVPIKRFTSSLLSS
jgi:hypothetical protein